MASLTDILQKLDGGDESQNGTQSAADLNSPDAHAGSDVNQIGEGGQSIDVPGNTDGVEHQEPAPDVDPNQAHNAPEPGNHVDAGHVEPAPDVDPNQAGTHKSSFDEDTIKSLAEVVSELKNVSNKFSEALSLVEKSAKKADKDLSGEDEDDDMEESKDKKKSAKKADKDLDEDEDMDESMGKGKGTKGKGKVTDENKSVTATDESASKDTHAEEPELPSEDIVSVSDEEKTGEVTKSAGTEENKSVQTEPETAKAVSSDTTDKSTTTEEAPEGKAVDTDKVTEKSYLTSNGDFTNEVPAQVLLSDMEKSVRAISRDYSEGPNSPRVHAITHLYEKLTNDLNENKSVSSSLIESYNSIK